MITSDSDLMTIKEVAEYLGCHPQTVRNMESSGKIKAIRFGSGQRKMVRFKASEIKAMIEKGGNDE